MPRRDTWPRGLRLIFWLAVLGLTIGFGQTLYWLFVAHEFYPQLTIQGAYAAVALLLNVACVAGGALGYRRAFAIASLITAAFHIGVTVYFNLDIIRTWLPDIFAGPWQFMHSWDVNNWSYAWNSIEITVNALVCYYLLRYEFRFFGVLAV